MAERRMFAKTIVLSDAFLDMPTSARCLYFTLGMLADDDGFVNNPKAIMRQCGSSDDDMRVLMAKRFLLEFEDGVIVIKHWRIHNYIQKDRYKPTKYQDEMALLSVDENGAYKLDTPCIQIGYEVDTQVRLGKDRKGKDRKDTLVQSDEPPAAVEAVILNDGSEWRPSQSQYEEYVRLYPNCNVENEFRKMRGWCDANVSKRKTKAGVKRFVASWLARAQDTPSAKASGKKSIPVPNYWNPDPNRKGSGEKLTPEEVEEAKALLQRTKK